MQKLEDAVLESWDRQVRIVDNLANFVPADLRNTSSGEGEWTISQHFAHIHHVRADWLSEVAPGNEKGLPQLVSWENGDFVFVEDFDAIRAGLGLSAKALRDTVGTQLENPVKVGPYSHPLFFLQHMIWHEGWHVSSIMRTLRAVGKEPSEEWEEDNIWAIWRS